jgi:LmbE family N-acetylglucosaminyl deacetylase
VTNNANQRVLAVGAHPDDVEFMCAGTLALLKDEGWEIHIASLTPGDCGTAEMPAEEIAACRRGEAQRAAEVLGAQYTCLEFRDLRIFFNDEGLMRVVELVRRVDPHLVFAPPPQDYMPDHEEASRLVQTACFAAPAPNYATRTRGVSPPPNERIPHLYYCDPAEGKDILGRLIPASTLVDIGEAMECKTEMLACHESQRNWLRRQHGTDEYLDMMKEWASVRGREAGCQFAEGFRQHLGHAYPQDNLLKQLLGDRVRVM